MSFFNLLSNWWNNTVLKATYDPAADALKSLYNQNISTGITNLGSTIAGLGGGLGGAITSIPGVSSTTVDALNGLKKASQDIMDKAQSMTPSQIAEANDKINQDYQTLLAKAQAEGTEAPPPPSTDLIGEAGYGMNKFFNTVFSTTMYIIIFAVVIFLAFLGSSLASNANIDKPLAYRIYYMIYGFILFPIPLIQGLINYFHKKKLFYALWAPLHKGYSSNAFMNLFLFPFVYTDIIGTKISNFSSTSLVTQPMKLQEPQEPISKRNSGPENSGIPTNLKNPVVPIDLEERSERISFGPTRV
jgi:hypothetical protein